MFFAYSPDLFYLSRRTVQVRNNDKPYLRVEFKSLFQRLRIHIPGIILGVYEDGLPILIGDGVDGCAESHIRAENPMPLQGAFVWPCLTIQPFSRQLDCEVQRSRTCGQRNSIFAANIVRNLLFYLVDVRPDG